MVFGWAFLENEFIKALMILVGFVLATNLVHIMLRTYVNKFAKKTKTDIDDVIIKKIIRPLYFLGIVFGVYFALGSVTMIAKYSVVLSKICFVFVILIIAVMASRVLGVLLEKWLRVQKRFEKTPQLLNKILSVIIFIVAIVMILDYFEIRITPLVATLGIGGLAVGLALQNTLSNFFAGLHILSDRPVTVGDFIELEGNISGYVEDIGWRSTRLRTLPNTIVIIPNSKLAESVIINDSLPEQEMAALLQCGVSYESNLDKVEKVTKDVARKIQKTVPGAVKNFEPFIRYHTFSDSNINFTVILRVEKIVDKYLVIHEFMKALKKSYDKEGIEISWPVRKIYKAK